MGGMVKCDSIIFAKRTYLGDKVYMGESGVPTMDRAEAVRVTREQYADLDSVLLDAMESFGVRACLDIDERWN